MGAGMERVREKFQSYYEYKDFYTNSKGYDLNQDKITDDDLKGIPTLDRWKWALDKIFFEELHPKKILDIGSWTGRWPVILKENGYSVECLEANKAAYKTIPKYLKKYNKMVEEFSGKYDLITCFEVIEHAYDMDLFVNKLKDLLNPNGTLILSTPAKDGIYDDDNEIHLWIASLDSLINTFKDWEIMDYKVDDLILMEMRKNG